MSSDTTEAALKYYETTETKPGVVRVHCYYRIVNLIWCEPIEVEDVTFVARFDSPVGRTKYQAGSMSFVRFKDGHWRTLHDGRRCEPNAFSTIPYKPKYGELKDIIFSDAPDVLPAKNFAKHG